MTFDNALEADDEGMREGVGANTVKLIARRRADSESAMAVITDDSIHSF